MNFNNLNGSFGGLKPEKKANFIKLDKSFSSNFIFAEVNLAKLTIFVGDII